MIFAICANDMMEEVTSYMSLLADDAKLMRKEERKEDCTLQDLNVICKWSQEGNGILKRKKMWNSKLRTK